VNSNNTEKGTELSGCFEGRFPFPSIAISQSFIIDLHMRLDAQMRPVAQTGFLQITSSFVASVKRTPSPIGTPASRVLYMTSDRCESSPIQLWLIRWPRLCRSVSIVACKGRRSSCSGSYCGHCPALLANSSISSTPQAFHGSENRRQATQRNARDKQDKAPHKRTSKKMDSRSRHIGTCGE
jgi:hypothetical protein